MTTSNYRIQGATKHIGVERIHLEQDAGKLLHDQHPTRSYVDLNRCGVALLSGFFLAVFLIKYRIEYLVTLPAFALLFAQYLALSLRPGSAAQRPEKLFQETGLMIVVSLLVLLFVIATFVEMPFLEPLTGQQFIRLG